MKSYPLLVDGFFDFREVLILLVLLDIPNNLPRAIHNITFRYIEIVIILVIKHQVLRLLVWLGQSTNQVNGIVGNIYQISFSSNIIQTSPRLRSAHWPLEFQNWHAIPQPPKYLGLLRSLRFQEQTFLHRHECFHRNSCSLHRHLPERKDTLNGKKIAKKEILKIFICA